MKEIGIVTDSHSSISQEEAKKIGIRVLPMPFYIDGECFYEGVTLSREAFFEKLEGGADVSTSQPSPADVMNIWDEALAEYKQILYMPLSSGLSGSYMTAAAIAEEEKYRDKVFVVDHGRTATPLHRSILDSLELIEEGYGAAQIKEIIEDARDKMSIYIGVDTLEYLKKGGRVTPAAAAIGSVLHIKPVLQLDVGKLDSYKKCRGFAKARKIMIEALREDLDTRFKEWYDRGEICLMAASAASAEETEQWVHEIEEAFPGHKVMCDYLSLGVCCHTGAGALGIGCSCRPGRPDKK
ncbi:MAG: DegV family protein [Eubacteriales bacterium]|nr:DegV family protein [Eubacteriales bacterium]